ncbi:MAG: hypothetical protein JWL62_2482 [Hyphomicrobiales bacterium]|nr:hypothetical protein [Hyphomicrobiales bacterium]
MIRFLVRVVALLLLAGAFVALVLDGTRSIAGGAITFTDVGSVATALFPQRFALVQPFIEQRLWPFLWNPVLIIFLGLPIAIVLAVVGAILLMVSRPAVAKIGYSSRP